MKNPKVKGSTFERTVATMLNELFADPEMFWRTSASGARGAFINNDRGDIKCNKFNMNLVIECKHWTTSNIFPPGKNYYDLLKNMYERYDFNWICIIKNRYGIFMMLPNEIEYYDNNDPGFMLAIKYENYIGKICRLDKYFLKKLINENLESF